MKKLRTTIIILTIFFGGMVFTGCADGDTSYNTQGQEYEQDEGKEMESSGKKQAMDSINALSSKIEELSTKQKSNIERLDEVLKDVSDLKGTSHLFDLISWVIAAIALLTAIIALIKLNSIQNRAHRLRRDLSGLLQRLNDLELKISSKHTVTRTSTYSGINANKSKVLEERLSRIEQQLLQDQHPNNQMQVGGKTVGNNGQRENILHGFFGVPSQMSTTEAYFKKFEETQNSDSRFTVEVRGTLAKFKPILESPKLLNGIKSGDVIKFALEFEGCALHDAKQMKVISPGEAAINKNGEWIITKKALISLAQ